MPDSPNRVVIDRVDWKSVLPVLRLASAFKHALQPGKLLVALAAVLAIHLSGLGIDALLGMNESNDGPGDTRAYEELIRLQAGSVQALFSSALALDHGYGPSSVGALDALYAMFVETPAYVFKAHPWFSLLFGIDVLFVLAMAGGVLTRMCASQVCGARLTTLPEAAGYVQRRWVWYLLTPLMPAMLIVVAGAVLALAGLVLFSIPGVDVVGSLGYGLLLLLGFVIAVIVLLLLLALFLMPPALSVEGSDGFDAIARSFNYILFRPWQFAGYLLSSAVYLAVVYVLVITVASLSIEATGYFVGLGTVGDAEPTEAAAWVMTRWIELVIAVVIAILISTLCCLQTQVYVLMRRSADGTPIDQYEGGGQPDLWSGTPTRQAGDDDSAEAED